jgi:hypothetical protein
MSVLLGSHILPLCLNCFTCVLFKEWPHPPNLQDSHLTRANLSRQVTFFSKIAFGKCRRVWRVRATRLGECRRVWRVRTTRLSKCWQVWRVRATQLGECRQVWPVRATRLCASAHDKIGLSSTNNIFYMHKMV